MKMRHVEDFRSVWDQIEPGVKAALECQNERMMAGDVFMALKTRDAILFMDGEAFFIVKKSVTATGEKMLLCWIAYSPVVASDSAIATYQPDIMEVAVREGMAVIDFVSTRRGYEKIMPALGWEYLHSRYRLRLIESHEGESPCHARTP